MTIIMREKDVFNVRRGGGGVDGRNMGGGWREERERGSDVIFKNK